MEGKPARSPGMGSGKEIPHTAAEALGIPLSELFPPSPRDTPEGPGGRGPYIRNTRDLLAAARHEALIVVLALEAHWRGEDLSLEDEDRVFEAVRRLRRFAYDIAR